MVADHKDGRKSKNSLVANNLVSNRITIRDSVIEMGNWVVNDDQLSNFFVSPEDLDFRLTLNSPAKDAAVRLDACPAYDFFGVSRPQGSGFDIGAVECIVNNK